MRLHEKDIDFTTLTWVKPELDETLRQARNALQNYVEEGESPAELRTCSDLLHQVQGTLRMVELYGASMVAEEMEQLSHALIEGKVDNRDNAYAVLMQGIVQLPDYLERLQSGHRDIPIVLLPLLNQLRESRGEKGLNESVLFSPDLSRPLPASAQGPQSPLDQSELTRRAEALRSLYQSALLRWLKDDNSAATIRDLTDVCEQLVPITSAEPARRLFWVAAGTLDALGKNAFPISNPLKQALAKVEREIKRLADGGDAAFRNDPPIELTKQLLYFVAHEGSDVGRIGEIRKVFGLSGSEPSEAELAHARGSLSGNNRALLETVAVAIKEDLLRVKDALDLHLRTPGAKPAELGVQVDALDRVADTLGMLGLDVPRRVVQDQRSAINDVVSGLRKDDEETLLDIAGALLYVEAALDDQVERLGKEGTESPESSSSASSNESRRLLEVLVKEAIVNFSQARQAFVAFVETHWDHAQLAEVPRLLSEVAGALRILNIPLPADYLVGVRQFTDNELLRRRHVPSGQQMDRLADALASLEYFLEALRDRRPNREQILEVARQSLAALGYWPLSAEVRATAPMAAAVAAPAPVVVVAPAPMLSDAVETAELETDLGHSVEAPAVAAAAPAPVPALPIFANMVGPSVPGFDGASSEEIDDEIREVFLEEFEEEIENLAQLLPSWAEDPANAELLRPIRRVFHTLKGSGRLVGAKTLGEFSWKIESLLNRVLDGSRPASPEVLALVQIALNHLPLLRAALQGQDVHADLEGIQVVAEQLAAGEEVSYRGVFLPGQEEAVSESVEAEAQVDVPMAVEATAEEPEEIATDGQSGPRFSIDPVLLEILKPEVAGHLEVVDAWLAECAARGPQPVSDPLLRSIHTMNGAFAMTEVLSITEVTAPLEGFIKRSLAHNLNPGEAGVAVVADAVKAIRSTIGAIEKPRPVLPHFEELSARAYALRDSLPDSLLPSVPVHAEEEVSIMPQVVVMEAADVSAIPKFEEAAAADVEAEAVADVEAEAELEVQETVAAEAEPTTSIEPIDFESIEFGAFEMESPEIVASFEAEGALESAAVEPELEIEAVQEPEVEAVQEPEVEAAKEPEHPEEVEAEVDAAQELEPEPELAVDAEVVREPEVEAVQETEFATEAESTQEPELAAEVDLAEEPELAAEVDLAEEPEFAMEAESVPVADVAIDEGPVEAETAMEYVQVEETVEYAELPEGELLSLEDFLRDAGEQMARLVQDEMAEETVEPGEQSQAMAAPEATGEAQVAEVEGFAEDMESIDFESAFGPMPTLEPVQVGEAVEAPLETETHEAAVSEAAASEVEAFETEAASEAEAFEAAAPETAAVTEAPEPAGSNALATMIAAYSSEDMAAEQTVADDVAVNEDFIALEEPENVEQFAADEFVITDEFRDELLLADERLAAEFAQESEQPAAAEEAVAESIEPQPEAESQPEVESQPEPQLVAAGDEYYGMSLAELEALTAPEAQAPTAVETDGFADLPSIAEVPAWAGAGEASETTETAEATETAESVAEALAEPAVEPQVESPVVEVEMLEMPEIVDAPELTEVTDLSELVDAGESADVEIQSTEEAVAEDVVVEEPVAEQAVVEEPIAEQIAAEEIYFDDDHDEEPAEAAAAPVESAEADEVVHVARPNVPMAQDPADPDSDLDLTDLDTELLDLFLEESNDILDHSDGMLARLREQVEDRDAITNLQRDLHTLKGGARMAGIYAVGELGHAMESLLESVAEGRQDLDATGVVVLERGFDRLHGMVARIGQRKAIALPAGLIAQVEALAEGRALDTAEAGEIIERAATAPKRTAAEAPLNPLSAPMDELGAEDEMTGVRAPQEQVRIRADLLDRLVNYAGEVAIYRARLEQQLGAFRSNLGELNQTTTRLREQLRRLDIETEAQIIARYQREGEANDERFDPLELDRFTNQQQLTRALNESANDLVNLQGVLDELTRQYETLLLQQSRVSSDLQEGLMRTRMVPFDALVPRLRRVLRQAATDTGKQVQLKVDGASGEMDRNVLERMTAPLEHMLRNAMAHGLELPAERRKARKPEEGTVRIAVQREGSEVVLKVSDDGYGLDKQAIREKALERGLIKPDVELSDEALYGMILESGFSTAQTISRLSGRGVGMDVVYSEIRQLGGTLQIRSEQGKGSEFVIRLPFTLAVTQAVFVKIGDTSFAVPIASVQGVGRIARADLDKQLATDNPVFNYAGEDYAIHDLGLLIGHAPAKAQDSLQMPLLLARSGDLRTAISIDQVLGSREIVVKPVGPQVNSVPGIFGATIMGDGRVVVILDVAPLVRRQSAIVREVAPVAPAAPAVAARRVPVVMVVDDSITMRKVTGRVLERNNMEVMTAKDGVDAVEKMAERVPDLVLLDIEMPRMDGYEVAQNMKSDPRLKDVPIIMITSRTGEKHRQRAMDIGVDRYLGKPYQEPELMRNVFDMLGVEAVNG